MKQSSVDRVRESARCLGLHIEIIELSNSTRTAREAAIACQCELSQIVKSLVFKNINDNQLLLFLLSGSNQLDLAKVEALIGGKLERSDPSEVRKKTGFAIGGVAPIGHMLPIPVFFDIHLLQFDSVYAAAGSPYSVFKVDPSLLAEKINATRFTIHSNVKTI